MTLAGRIDAFVLYYVCVRYMGVVLDGLVALAVVVKLSATGIGVFATFT